MRRAAPPALARVDGHPADAGARARPGARDRGSHRSRLRAANAAAALAEAAHRITGTMDIGGQEHFYLEGQIAVALPGEDDEMHVISSTQHPGEVQHMIAHVLDVPASSVDGDGAGASAAGSGGKETQSNLFAAAAALAARRFKPGRSSCVRTVTTT